MAQVDFDQYTQGIVRGVTVEPLLSSRICRVPTFYTPMGHGKFAGCPVSSVGSDLGGDMAGGD